MAGSSALPTERTGVSASFLRRLKAATTPTMSTSEACDQVIKPACLEQRCAYTDLFRDELGEDERPLVGPATVFVSHAWQYHLHDTIDVMLDYEMDSPDSYYWFDLVVNNQIIAPDRPFHWWSTTFMSSIKAIGSLLLILAPWDRPVLISRAWCLWELYCGVLEGVPVSIRLPRHQRRAFHDSLQTNFSVIMDSMLRIDVEKADCHLDRDRDQIFEAIRQQVGFLNLNERVKEPLRTWYLDTTIGITRAMALMEDPSERQASLFKHVALALYDFGRYDDAAHFGQLAVNSFSNLLGDSAVEVADALQVVAKVYLALGHSQRSVRLCQRALNIRRRLNLYDTMPTSQTLNTLGMSFSYLANYEESIKIFQEALDMQEALVGRRHAETSLTLNNLGNVLSRVNRNPEALELFAECLDIRRSCLGPNHPDIAITLNNLGNTFARTDRVKALDYYQQALNIREAAFGHFHAAVGASCNNIANMLTRLDRGEEAIELYKRSIEIREIALGPNHEQVARSYNNLAGVYSRKQRYSESVDLLRQALRIRAQQLPDDHEDLASTRFNLAFQLKYLEKYAEALQHLEGALRVREQHHTKTPTHMQDYLLALELKCRLLTELKRFSEAEELLVMTTALAMENKKLSMRLADLRARLDRLQGRGTRNKGRLKRIFSRNREASDKQATDDSAGRAHDQEVEAAAANKDNDTLEDPNQDR